jgi:hypothetical protein
MSQVKKHEQGGVAAGAPTPAQSQYAFKVNGNEYKADEQSIRDKFNGFFTDLVQKGEAHERDRDKWIGSYNRVIDNVKKGQYELTSSGGQLYQGKYDGEATPESLGLNPDGSTARKSLVGNFIGRANKSDAQRVSMLDHYFGNSIIGGYNDKQTADAKASAEAKAKADADAEKAKLAAGEGARSAYQANQRGFGESQYGDNYRTSPAMVLGDQYWGANTSDAQRYQMMLNHHLKQYKNMYDTTNDANLDPDVLKKLKAQREMGMQYFDPTSNKFKVPLRSKSLGDFEQLSNPFGLAQADAPFYNKAVYDKMLHPDGTPAVVDPALPKPLTQSGNLWTDGSTYWKDKDRKEMATNWVSDEHGKPRLFDSAGHPVDKDWHLEGKNPDNPYTGYFENGYIQPGRAGVQKGTNYMQSLAGDPIHGEALKRIQGNFSQIQSAYDSVLASPAWLKAKDNAETSDATYNVWAPYQKAGIAPQQTSDETAKYTGLNGKANVQMYISQHQNDYGKPRVFRMVTLGNNHKQFKGNIQTDLLGNVTGMLNEDGQPINDPDLINTLRGVTYNHSAANENPSNTDFSGVSGPTAVNKASTASNMLEASRKSEFKDGGIVKAQGGASINNSEAFENTATTSTKPSGPHEANVGDIAKSMTDPAYHLSGSDKAELAALGLNLGSLAASFTGVGSEAAAGLGAVGSFTQFGADTSREGFKWGNLGQLGLSLGLDAASAIPGIGIWADSTKVGKTLAKSARYLVPALTGLGMAKAANTVYKLASGQMKITDLSMDDLRDLTNGIHGVVGGARYATGMLGTQRAVSSTIKLADGTPVKLDAAGEQAIKEATDPAAVAKSVVARLTGKSADEVQLDQKSATQWGLNPLKTIRTWNSKADNANIIQTKGQVIPKDIADYQGGGVKNWLTRGAIPLASNRLAQSGSSIVDPKYKLNFGTGDVDQTSAGVTKGSNWNVLGDYGQRFRQKSAMNDEGDALGKVMGDRRQATGNYTTSGPQPTYEYEAGKTATVGDIPDTRRIFGSMFGMNKFDNERQVSFQQVRNRLQGLSGTASSRQQLSKFLGQDFEDRSFSKNIQDQIKQAMADPTSKGFVKFNNGGKLIPKHQYGNTIGQRVNTWGGNPEFMKGINDVNSWGDGDYTKPMDVTGISSIPKFLNTSDLQTRAQAITAGMPTDSRNVAGMPASGAIGSMGSTSPGQRSISLPRFNINPAMVSEFGRAIASSNINKQYDTRVERPMSSAPLEVPISVHGNLYAESMANQQADNIVRGVENFKTSDGTMQMLGNLEAQKQAGELRMQGGMQSNQTLQQTRAQALQSAVQNAQQRMAVANENIHTNASATQAERQQENLKRTMVAQPYLDFWQNANERAQQQYQQGRDLDTQISGISEEQKLRVPLQQISLAAQNVWYDEKIPQDQKMARYTQLMNASSTLQSRLSQKLLQYRKDPYATQPGSTEGYLDGIDLAQLLGPQNVPSRASGGALWRVAVQQMRGQTEANKQVSKESADEGKSVMDDETKKQISAMKGINDLIKMALK